MSNVKPIPEGFHAVTPYLVVEDAGKVAEFIKNAFGGKEHHRSTMPDGRVMHADLSIARFPCDVGQRAGAAGESRHVYLYVTDTDAVYARAIEAGGVSVMAPMNQFYGDRNAMVKDPGGNSWCIATHIEDVAPDELDRRAQEMFKKRAAQT